MLEFAGEKTLTEFMEARKSNTGMQRQLSDDEVRLIMGKLFQATEYLHRNNICHRDLKPDNIMLTADGKSEFKFEPLKVKIVDFNVAVEVDQDTQKIIGATGLREWSAPETRQKGVSDLKIDSWSLGCVMYYICTG